MSLWALTPLCGPLTHPRAARRTHALQSELWCAALGGWGGGWRGLEGADPVAPSPQDPSQEPGVPRGSR